MLKKTCISLGIILVIILLFLCNGWYIDIDESDTISGNYEYGENIKLHKADARLKGKIFFSKKGIPIFSDMESNFNRKELGTYTNIYSAHFLYLKNTIKTTVNIVDTTPPEISLKTIKYSTTSPCEIYKEEGYSARDRYDGDLTDKVTSYINDGKVYYSVTDSSGNVGTAVREIQYKTRKNPTINLIGEQIINIREHEKFIEPGFTAKDDCGEDLTERVEVTTDLNIEEPGKYNVNYFVKDDWDNYYKTSRTIIVNEIIEPENIENIVEISANVGNIEKPNILPQDTETSNIEIPEKVIYLTFDDGPSKYTKDLLKVLKDNDVKATFFVVGSQYSDVISDIYLDGHSIGIHSYSHNYKNIYSSMDSYFEDLEKIDNIIFEKTGMHTTLVRFPGGSSNTVSKFNKGIMTFLATELTNRGYTYFDWNVSSGDAGQTTATNEVYNNVIKGINGKKQAIVLQHDTHNFSIKAVQDIITWGKENGYTFLPLDSNSPTAHHKINN